MILSAWDFNEAYEDDEDNDRGNNDDNAFIDVEYGHDDLEDAGLMTMTTTSADMDNSDGDDEQTFMEWKLWSGGVASR
jgi:hypothetical protein